MNWTEITEALSHFAEPTYLYAAGAFIALSFALILLLRRQPKKIVAYRTENGRVMVSRTAIVELIRTSCQQINDVTKPSVKIKVKGKTTHFDVQIQLMSGGRLREIEQTLQEHLRHCLTENLGIENLGKINIVATGFKSGRIQVSSPITSKDKPAELDVIQDVEPESVEALQEELKQKSL
ncbi:MULTISPECIES: alkaline shock response membrane anchor protein AmaP [unclassified Lentimonas]|uniref:alkaline shock response membrane anchor protein AmaP n=1 Tax=unclassified Lentimonas TaxID=2630993 RepID=UPI0013264FC7|nr:MULTISPECIES: alkaline shock response membrane anchor protein AmaP [unclassified Lentimonas]CAA6676777.1 Unannotated [Lentimonas sp. CC4]CAA6684557.1 Unannotated [Lentimonas sp. CC6]CAA6694149.1 Unannotated [Lentimonas sp. CC10]CAA6694351.1 Unannotated [Lentimonas sp. CC19]CAA7071099.1 Unannotated [Lentimonas sp. CC11]